MAWTSQRTNGCDKTFLFSLLPSSRIIGCSLNLTQLSELCKNITAANHQYQTTIRLRAERKDGL